MKKIFVLLAVALLLTVSVSGCVMPDMGTGTTQQVKSQEEAANVVMNMSEDIGDVSSTLEDLEGLFE